jgi:hypothetical protein
MSAMHKIGSTTRFIAIGRGKALQIFHAAAAMSSSGVALVTVTVRPARSACLHCYAVPPR